MNALSLDVSSLCDVRQQLTEGVQKFNHIDVLVNCAGITHTATLVDTPSEKFKVHGCCLSHFISIRDIPRGQDFLMGRFLTIIFACGKKYKPHPTHNYIIYNSAHNIGIHTGWLGLAPGWTKRAGLHYTFVPHGYLWIGHSI